MAHNQASARPAQRKSDKSTKKQPQSSAPRAPDVPAPKPAPVKLAGELPVPAPLARQVQHIVQLAGQARTAA